MTSSGLPEDDDMRFWTRNGFLLVQRGVYQLISGALFGVKDDG